MISRKRSLLQQVYLIHVVIIQMSSLNIFNCNEFPVSNRKYYLMSLFDRTRIHGKITTN